VCTPVVQVPPEVLVETSVVSGAAAAPETHAAAPGAHAPVPQYAVDAAGCMRPSALLAFRWHVCALVQILSGLLTG